MAVFAINPSCSHSQEFEMTRFKFMSLWMLLLVIAARGITAFSQAPAPNPACYMKAGPPSGLCEGTDTTMLCAGCSIWNFLLGDSGVVWSTSITRGTDMGSDIVASNVIPCKTTTPCIATWASGKECDSNIGFCITGASTCPTYAPGTPIITTVTTYYTVPCPVLPPPPAPAPDGA